VTACPIIIAGIRPDGAQYPVEKIAAHRDGLLHLAISVFVFDGDLLLLQKRAPDKYHCGGLWTNTCCTHPHFGERPEVAAPRRLREELGFSAPLTHTGVTDYRADVGGGLIEHERVHMFHGTADSRSLRLTADPDEVSDTRWASRAELLGEVAARPDDFTPWFRIYLQRWPDFAFGAA
jgi:isopentenyl-diphosphate delta-isomerase